jgi:glycerol kinase
MARYVMGIDQGTTRTKALIVDRGGNVISSATREVDRYTPRPGWVEQDAEELLAATVRAAGDALQNGRIAPDEVEAIGICNQTGTTVLWDKKTGQAVGRAISWLDKRTLPICERLAEKDEEGIRSRTGMLLAPNGAGTKLRWLMEHDKAIQRGIADGSLLFGTVETWLIWRLSGGKAHITDLSNASLNLLLNTATLTYDEWMLSELGVPREILPELRTSSELYAHTEPDAFHDARLPIASAVMDQFSAGFGQTCFRPGTLQCNSGTGFSLTQNTGTLRVPPQDRISSPVLWAVGGQVTRGFGGWVNVADAPIRWLRDQLGLVRDIAEAEAIAAQATDSGGVYFVPGSAVVAYLGDETVAGGALYGVTPETTKRQVVRAALEATGYQAREFLDTIVAHSQVDVSVVRTGGGASSSDFFLQALADIFGIPVERPAVTESSAVGAAFLAGLATGYWTSLDEVAGCYRVARTFDPRLSAEQRDEKYQGWKRAVLAARSAAASGN